MTRLMLWAFEGLYETVKQVIPDEKWARRVAPLTITMFPGDIAVLSRDFADCRSDHLAWRWRRAPPYCVAAWQISI